LRFNFIKQSLIGASIITFAANILSAFLGYFREAATASYFGTGAVLDVFVLAFTIPEILTSVIVSVLPTALIPTLKKSKPGSIVNESKLFWCGLVYFTFLLAGISFLVYLFRGNILLLFASDISVDQLNLGKRLVSIVSFFIFFRGMEFYFRAWLFEKKHFLIPVTSNILLGLAVLVSLLTLYNRFDIEALAYGWLFGSILVFIYNALMAFVVVKPGFNITFMNPWIKLLFQSFAIISIIEIVSMTYPLIDRYLAFRYLGPGFISALRFAMVLIVLPNRLFAVAYSTASFPWISDLSQNGEIEKLRKMYQDSIRMIIFLMGLIAVNVAVFADDIVLIAFQRGAFDQTSLNLTSGPLRIYAAGIAFSAAYIYQMRFYYARMEYKRLGLIKAVMFMIKVVLSFILIRDFQQNGLALATSLAWLAGFLIMSADLSRRLNFSIKNIIFANGFKIALLISINVLFSISASMLWTVGNSQTAIFLKLIVLGMTGSVLYFGIAFMLNIPEPKKLVDIFAKKLRNLRV